MKNESLLLKKTYIETPLGQMIAIADEKALFVLDFVDRRKLENKIKQLQTHLITPGETAITMHIAKELNDYFSGTLTEFKTPVYFLGSQFQQKVWQKLQTIPYGKTYSYAHLANTIEKPSAFRAVAQANGANFLAIIIPCHRVINTNGKLGGYGGGITRKEFLLNHEKNNYEY